MANILYRKQKQQKSLDNGATWIDTGEYRVGDILENPSNCTSEDTKQCRWVELDASEGYYCDGYTKYTVQVEECSENGIIWTRTGNQQKGSTVIESNATDCGSTSGSCINNFYADPNKGEKLEIMAFNNNILYCEPYILNYNDFTFKKDDYNKANYYYYIRYYNLNYSLGEKYNNVIYIHYPDSSSLKVYYRNGDSVITLIDENRYADYEPTLFSTTDSIYIVQKTSSDVYVGYKIDSNYNVEETELINYPEANTTLYYPKEVIHEINGEHYYNYYYDEEPNFFHNVLVYVESVEHNSKYGLLLTTNNTLYQNYKISFTTDNYAVCYDETDSSENSFIIDKNGNITDIGEYGRYILNLTELPNSDVIYATSSGYYYYDGSTFEEITSDVKNIAYGYYITSFDILMEDGGSNILFYKPTEYDYKYISFLGSKSTPASSYMSFIEFANENGSNYDERLANSTMKYSYYSSKTKQFMLWYTTNDGDLNNTLITICYDDVMKYLQYAYQASYDINISGETNENVLSLEKENGYNISFKINDKSSNNFGNPYSVNTGVTSFSHSLVYLTREINPILTTCYQMFSECYGLTKITSFPDTSNVTDMSYMFEYCVDLTSVDLSSINTSNVTDMRYMFYNCSNLATLNVTGWNISKVTSYDNMFKYANNLTKLILGNVSQTTYDWWLARLTDVSIQAQVTIEYTIV